MIEQLSEKWYDFLRIHCREGYVDYWAGSSSDDPNLSEKSKVSFYGTYCLRFKDTWINKRYFERNAIHSIKENKDTFSSDELFEMLINKDYEIKR